MSNNQQQRQNAILSYLPEHPNSITTRELLSRIQNDGFKGGIRTLQRDLDSLSHSNHIGRDESQRSHQWFRYKGVNRSAFEMSASTALVLSMAEKHLHHLLPVNLQDNMSGFFTQANKTINSNPRMKLWTQSIASVHPGFQPLAPNIRDDILHIIEKGIIENKKVEISYRPRPPNVEKNYIINPLALVTRANIIYLIATLSDSLSFRHFALHRLSDAHCLLSTRAIPESFNLENYLSAGHFSFYLGESIHLKLKIDYELGYHLLETPLSNDQKVTIAEDKTYFVIETSVAHTEELKWWLMSMSNICEVIAPVHLRIAVIESLTIAVNKYK
ncbi:WYL domain-containing protein [Shewanella frigidimarina]|uniref:helix-turn-helix transcriptional regulator n=1 Tax=Shewanella frigidimarina TaxID=56812 RepID=UPI003176A65E